ncbi:MAG TPA: Crp/Fnr family transcriptional regulator [Candidatus Limnocylindria bacterium]|nr:Crp/Fnr family transcriptional regulator [Candidatus Limnocylindria bacterium]
MRHEDAKRVADILTDRSFRAGEEIPLRPTGETVYIVKAGRVRIESGGVAMGVLGPAQLFGTSSLFGAAPVDERAIAVEDVILCEAPAGAFLMAMTSHPLLAARTAQLLARQLYDLQRSVQRAAQDPVEARLASLVLQLADCNGDHQVLGLSQAELARLIGASRESVSRLMAAWERDGLVRARHRALEVSDEVGLRARVRGSVGETAREA